MSEIEFKASPKTIFGFILIILGIIAIIHSIVRGILELENFSVVVGTEYEVLVKVFAWFFSLLIEGLGGFFLALIGLRIRK